MAASAGAVARWARSARKAGCETIDPAVQGKQGVGVRRYVGGRLESFGFQGGTPISQGFGTQAVDAADAQAGAAESPARVLASVVDLAPCFELCVFEGGLVFAFRREHLVNPRAVLGTFAAGFATG